MIVSEITKSHKKQLWPNQHHLISFSILFNDQRSENCQLINHHNFHGLRYVIHIRHPCVVGLGYTQIIIIIIIISRNWKNEAPWFSCRSTFNNFNAFDSASSTCGWKKHPSVRVGWPRVWNFNRLAPLKKKHFFEATKKQSSITYSTLVDIHSTMNHIDFFLHHGPLTVEY